MKMNKIISLLTILWVIGLGVFTERPAYAANSYIQAATGKAALATVTSGNITTTSGNMVALAVCSYLGTGTLTINDSNTNTWNLVETKTLSNVKIYIYYAKNITGGAGHNFTATYATSAGFIQIIAAEFSGADTSAPLDQHTNNSGTGTVVNTGSVTTSDNGEIYFGVESHSPQATITESQTKIYEDEDNTTGQAVAVSYQITTSGSNSNTWTLGTGGNWIGAIASFKAATTASTVKTLAATGVG